MIHATIISKSLVEVVILFSDEVTQDGFTTLSDGEDIIVQGETFKGYTFDELQRFEIGELTPVPKPE